MYVEPSTDAGRSRWRGGGMGLEFDMCRRIRELLVSDTDRGCWSQRARAKLIEGRITSDNFAVKIEAHAPPAGVEQAITDLRTADPASLLPSIDADALTALKFVNCLPPALAQQMLQQRVLDEPGLRSTLHEPCRFVSS